VIHLSVSIEIDVPADELFAFASDAENNPQWQSGVVSTEWTTPPPVGVGSRYSQQMEYRDLVTSYKITGLEAGRSLTIESEGGATNPTTVTRIVEPAGDTTSVITSELAIRTRGVRRLIQPLLKRVIRNSVEADYRRMKRLFEDEPEAEDD